MKTLAGSFEIFVEINRIMEIRMKRQENMASIMNNIVSSASTTNRKQDKLLNILLQETDINLSAKVEQTV